MQGYCGSKLKIYFLYTLGFKTELEVISFSSGLSFSSVNIPKFASLSEH